MLNVFRKSAAQSIYVNDLDDLLGKIDLIDIRESYEYARGSMATAKNIPMGELLAEPEKYMNKNNTYYIMCQSGARSARTSDILAKKGFQVINVSGGIGSYAGKKLK